MATGVVESRTDLLGVIDIKWVLPRSLGLQVFVSVLDAIFNYVIFTVPFDWWSLRLDFGLWEPWTVPCVLFEL